MSPNKVTLCHSERSEESSVSSQFTGFFAALRMTTLATRLTITRRLLNYRRFCANHAIAVASPWQGHGELQVQTIHIMNEAMITPSTLIRILRLGASISLIALIVLSVTWETVLAPLKPNGSMLMLKAVPLLLPLFGILHGKRYTYQWASMFILLYFTEGVVRAWSDVGVSAHLANIEIVLSVLFFACATVYARQTRAKKSV
jgi:uncharacterized membrane protein